MDILSAATAFFSSIRLQDVLDVAIITTMIFALLMWFKTRASRYVLVGVVLLGGVYLAARFFQLYLTVLVLQGFFAILLFVLVVIFQEDLRGLFERLAMLGNLRKEARPLSELEKTAAIIAEAAGELAKKRIGALIVISGHDPLERHLTGGISLDGQLSIPLLSSIFDPHSAGHDGAVIITNNRVASFGCHLPLSINISQYENIGLRHTAALGLTERSDALCIVVSEERGSLSVAQGKSLTVISGASLLNDLLEKFYARFQPAPRKKIVWGWLRENTKEKLLALGLACLLWVSFGYQRDVVRRDVVIPIEYKNIPENWQMEEPRLSEARIIFEGSEQAFRLLDEKSLRLSLDLSSLTQEKKEFALTKHMVNTPSGLAVTGINPDKVRVSALKMIPATLPVRVRTLHALPHHLALKKMITYPSSLSVLMDPKMKAEKRHLETEPIDLRGISASTAREVNVVKPSGVSFPEGKTPVVRVTIAVKNQEPEP